jgi:lipopolysaccharide/colanic/teichoic acid biosynthesis glycosyltransferase
MKFGNNSSYLNSFKPAMDFVVAIIALIVSSPIFIAVSVLLFFVNGGKIFFSQERSGFLQRSFMAYKFRTMNDAKDNHGQLLPDGHRLTRIGRLIRKTSLDELPQLINILKGDMSFIGPRPLLPEYLPFYTDEQQKRHTVKPGITGLAQVNGRNLTTWEKRFEYDVYYVEHVSFLMDLKIFLKTIVKVLKSEGISAKGHATMPKFSEYMQQKNTAK